MKPVNRVEEALGSAIVIAAVGLCLWGVGIVLLQALGWLKYATWQPVPLSALLLSPEAQEFNLRMFSGFPNALDIVPSLGNMDSQQAAAMSIAGLAGVQIIVNWLLGVALSLWCLVGATVVAMTGSRLFD